MSRVSVIHHVPGRLRIRLPRTASSRHVEKRLLQHRGIRACRPSASAHSIVVEYQPSETDANAILSVVASVLGLPPEAISEPDGDERHPLSRRLVRFVARVNGRIATMTRGNVDLQVLLALTLIAWAGRQVVRGRARELPWSAALWYAYELFRHHSRAAALQGGVQHPIEPV